MTVSPTARPLNFLSHSLSVAELGFVFSSRVLAPAPLATAHRHAAMHCRHKCTHWGRDSAVSSLLTSPGAGGLQVFPGGLKGKTVVDVGSRLGAVLYGAALLSDAPTLIGIERTSWCALPSPPSHTTCAPCFAD